MEYIILFMAAMLATFITTPLVKKLAVRIGAVDQPNERKVHTKVMPRLGGLAIYLGFALVYLYMYFTASETHVDTLGGIFVGGTIIMMIGILDDRYQLSPKWKFFGQIVAAAAVVPFGIQVDFVNLPFDGVLNFKTDWISIPITIFWIVAVTNAINLIDGLDGLAAGVSAIATGTLMVIAFAMGNVPAAMISAILLGSIMGFLYFNFYPAKIFMGDTGALFLGYNLAVLSLLGFKSVTLFTFIIPILVLGVPLSDTFFAIVRRVLNKKPISVADKSHLHHCLLHLGFSHRQTVLMIYGISLLFGVSAVIFYETRTSLWIPIIIVGLVIIALTIGAEIIGLVGKRHRPVLRALRKIKRFGQGLKPKQVK